MSTKQWLGMARHSSFDMFRQRLSRTQVRSTYGVPFNAHAYSFDHSIRLKRARNHHISRPLCNTFELSYSRCVTSGIEASRSQIIRRGRAINGADFTTTYHAEEMNSYESGIMVFTGIHFQIVLSPILTSQHAKSQSSTRLSFTPTSSAFHDLDTRVVIL